MDLIDETVTNVHRMSTIKVTQPSSATAFVDRFNDFFEDNEGFATTNENETRQVECARVQCNSLTYAAFMQPATQAINPLIAALNRRATDHRISIQ